MAIDPLDKARSDLNVWINKVKGEIETLNKGERLKLDHVATLITEKGKTDQTISAIYDKYQKAEKSPTTRMKYLAKFKTTLKNLDKATERTWTIKKTDTRKEIEEIKNKVKTAYKNAQASAANIWGKETPKSKIDKFIDSLILEEQQQKLSFQELAQRRISKRLKAPAERMQQAVFQLFGRENIDAAFLKGTTLTVSLKTTIQNFRLFLKDCEKELTGDPTKKIESFLKTLEDTLDLSEKIDVTHKKHKTDDKHDLRVNDVVAEIKEKIDTIKEGEQLVIPGGYYTKETGHAILYVVGKDKEGQLYFQTKNTGEGVGKLLGLAESIAGEITNKYHDPKITGLKKEDLSSGFIEQLIRQQTDPKPENSMKQIHQIIRKNLLKKKKHTSLKPGHYHDIQTIGSCSYDCTMSWIEEHLDPIVFGSFQLYQAQMGKKMIQRYIPQVKNPDKTDHSLSAKERIFLKDKNLWAKIGGKIYEKGQSILKFQELGNKIYDKKSDKLLKLAVNREFKIKKPSWGYFQWLQDLFNLILTPVKMVIKTDYRKKLKDLKAYRLGEGEKPKLTEEQQLLFKVYDLGKEHLKTPSQQSS